MNKPRLDGGPLTFWVGTALTDRKKLTDLRASQLGPHLKQQNHTNMLSLSKLLKQLLTENN